jgi:hypothetical protein
LQKAKTTNEGFSTSIKGWNKMSPSMPDITPPTKPQKFQEFVNSQNKLILVEEIFRITIDKC